MLFIAISLHCSGKFLHSLAYLSYVVRGITQDQASTGSRLLPKGG